MAKKYEPWKGHLVHCRVRKKVEKKNAPIVVAMLICPSVRVQQLEMVTGIIFCFFQCSKVSKHGILNIWLQCNSLPPLPMGATQEVNLNKGLHN